MYLYVYACTCWGEKTERPCTHDARREALVRAPADARVRRPVLLPFVTPTAAGRSVYRDRSPNNRVTVPAVTSSQRPPPLYPGRVHDPLRTGGRRASGPGPLLWRPPAPPPPPNRPPDRPSPPPPPPHRRVRVFGPRGGGGGVFPARRDVVEHSRSVVPVDRTVGVRAHTAATHPFPCSRSFSYGLPATDIVSRARSATTHHNRHRRVDILVHFRIGFRKFPFFTSRRFRRLRVRIGPHSRPTTHCSYPLSPTAAGSARRTGFSLAR